MAEAAGFSASLGLPASAPVAAEQVEFVARWDRRKGCLVKWLGSPAVDNRWVIGSNELTGGPAA